MKRFWIIFLLVFFIAAQSGWANLSKHIVDYRIKARLLAEEKAIEGTELLTWLNDSFESVSELQFHLYLNAFKNSRTTFMRESGGIHRGFKLSQTEWGYINVEKIEIVDGADLTSAMEFIQPDDGNLDDQTVMRVVLPEPVPPQGEISLSIKFFAKLPKVFSRSGYYDEFYMVAQWFPKIGVLWQGEWNCHQYHANSEFFADFGVFHVEMTVPEEYVLGATGKRIEERANGDGTRTYVHTQEDVHDFAWTACPDFREFRETFVLEDPPVETEMILLVHKSHLNQKERYASSLKNGIEFYSQNYGPYPYPTITLVDPPIKAMGAGGMEYPTLFTSMAISYIPKGLRLAEMVTIHEFGHGYWYGIVASNEFEEAWLDEGITTYSEIKAMNQFYGEKTSMMDWAGLKMSDLDMNRLTVMASSKLDPILKKSWEYYNGGSYGVNSYAKPGLVLLTLENYLGEDVMKKLMRAYYERWKFKHPTSQDFIAVAEEVSGQDLTWFFGQFLNSPDFLDYALGSLRSREVKDPQGVLDTKNQEGEPDRQDETDDKMYKNEVVVIRKGELIFPQEILIEFENGEEIRETWDGQGRWQRFVYIKPTKLKQAQVDPDNKVVLDVNLTNNSRMRQPRKTSILKYALRWMAKFQNLLSYASF